MFGYVTVCKDELKVRDYELFRGYYCGLCRALGKNCSQVSRLGLSYDMTFLVLLLSAIEPEPPELERCRCVVHPQGKRKSVSGGRVLDYAANMSVLLVYLKLADDWADDKSLKALLGMAAYYPAVRKAKKRYPKEYEEIRACLSQLSDLEKAHCAAVDQTADCFARILQRLFCPDFAKEQHRQLDWLGYNMGRWIYMIDAFYDLQEDYEKKRYNPFLESFPGGDFSEWKNGLAEELEPSFTYTLSNAASAYELLTIYKNDEILRNILYLSLKMKQDGILNGKERLEDSGERNL